MAQYRKKPGVIEAMQFHGHWEGDARVIVAWANSPDIYCSVGNDTTIVIKTLEGEMVATEGDYIIKGVKGEFYPCKPDIFELTYEPVST